MEIAPFDAKAGPDRFSTSEEIRSALSFLPDLFVEDANDGLWEVASDLGGHVLIDLGEDEALILLEKLDETSN
jgi:hypothetical protein